MVDPNIEFERKLALLEQELEEGEITTKGFEKRRTLLFNEYLGTTVPETNAPAPLAAPVRTSLSPAPVRTSLTPAALAQHNEVRSSSFAERAAREREAQAVAQPVQSLRQQPRQHISQQMQTPYLAQQPPNSHQRNVSGSSGQPVHYQEAAYAQSQHVHPQHDAYAPTGGLQVSNGDRKRESLESAASAQYLGVEEANNRRSFDGSLYEPGSRLSTGLDSTPRTHTMLSSSYAFNPANDPQYSQTTLGQESELPAIDEVPDRRSTMLDQGYFSDFTGQQSEAQNPVSFDSNQSRYSTTEPKFSPTMYTAPPPVNVAEIPPPNHQAPLEPRELPFAIYDPLNSRIPMSQFESMIAVLSYRARHYPKQPAFWVLDAKGKETASITWDKVAARAEKVASVIRLKSNLYAGDRVALVYRDSELVEFAVALLGCFIAGVVAVPINDKSDNRDFIKDYRRMNHILTATQAHLLLTTEMNLKNFQREITTYKLNWPRGVEWWKTNDFGTHHSKKKDDTKQIPPELAYIEFAMEPLGEVRGVVISHRTIMHQMAILSAIVASIPERNKSEEMKHPQPYTSFGGLKGGETILSYLDPRQSIGMIFGILFAVYGGHTTVWVDNGVFETPGLYAHLLTKYKASLMVADYPGLRLAAYNYLSSPLETRNFKKNFEPNFAAVKLCLIDTLTVDSEFHEILSDRWLAPMRNTRAREIVAPMLCLPEHGGMVISMRDFIGGEERMGCPLNLLHADASDDEDDEEKKPAPTGYSSLLNAAPTKRKKRERIAPLEILLDKESLKTNEVVIVASGEEALKRANENGVIRVGAFGYPIPDATLAVVDPDSNLLCTPNVIGEIWVDSPSLSGGFWASTKLTESIFRARPYRFLPGNPTPMPMDLEFLRTGLLGVVIDGRIFVLGLYEDRLRQRVPWKEYGMNVAEHRHYFVQHLITSLMKAVPKIFDATAFDVAVNEEHLPVILLESPTASTAPLTVGGPPRALDIALLESLSERCMEVLLQEHHLRVYCVMITAPKTLPRVFKNGREEIGSMLCRKEFNAGSLPCVHVKFGVERAVTNLPVGIDPVGGIWSAAASAARQQLLNTQDRQYTGMDFHDTVMDERTSTPLNKFTNICELLHWRVQRQPDELAYMSLHKDGKEGKAYSWKKFDQKVAGVAVFLNVKCRLKAGSHVVLMYTHSEDYVYAVYACFMLGLVAIPMGPLDESRLSEDAPAFLHLTSNYNCKAVLGNSETTDLLKQKNVASHLKQTATLLKTQVPPIYNTSKASKTSTGCREHGFSVKPEWTKPTYPVLIWAYWTPDQRRVAVALGHDTIMGICKVQKETAQMTASRPLIGCVRSISGLGFVHTCLLGAYLGTTTYLVSPVDFSHNPHLLLTAIARYKIKDLYCTAQMLEHAMSFSNGRNYDFTGLQNLMIAYDGRPQLNMHAKTYNHFAASGLTGPAINSVYSHVLNPMISSRSYMSAEPVELYLDPQNLRRGLIFLTDLDSEPHALKVQDSGMVPVNTKICIVNPESSTLSHVGEYGEIWVASDACVKAYYGSSDPFDVEKLNGRLVDGDPAVRWVRTGDLGFLHEITRPVGVQGTNVNFQVLFVLGAIGDTFELNGLSHFPFDIENSVERCHRNITSGGCAVFQAGGMTVVLVEVVRKAYLASMVPVIVNTILDEHQVVADIVGFVAKGDFPRSRLGEKQRGKILAGWITRKLSSVAQFGIRTPDGALLEQLNEIPEPRASDAGSLRRGTMTSSLLSPETTSSFGHRPRISITSIDESKALELHALEGPEEAYAELEGGEPTPRPEMLDGNNGDYFAGQSLDASRARDPDQTPLATHSSFENYGDQTIPSLNLSDEHFGRPPFHDDEPLFETEALREQEEIEEKQREELEQEQVHAYDPTKSEMSKPANHHEQHNGYTGRYGGTYVEPDDDDKLYVRPAGGLRIANADVDSD